MPVIHKPPISLNDDEILCVIAYLQSLGGRATVTMQTTHQFSGAAPSSEVTSPPIAAAGVTESLDGPEIFNRYLCATCHKTDGPEDMVGPSLYDVGKRLSKAELYEAILDPDVRIVEGYSKGLMTTTLNAAEFYEKVSSKELTNLVEYLVSLKGAQ
jgi:mono/diheme cytochrome c family protein